MRTTVLAAMFLAALAGCGGSVGGKSPEATFRQWKSAVSDRSYGDVWEMVSAASKEQKAIEAQQLSEEAKKAEGPARTALDSTARFLGMSLDDMKKLDGRTLFIADMKMAAESGRDEWDRMSRAEFARADEKGDRASVYVRFEGREDPNPMPLVRENGIWKIDLPAVPLHLPKPGDIGSSLPAPAPAPEKSAP